MIRLALPMLLLMAGLSPGIAASSSGNQNTKHNAFFSSSYSAAKDDLSLRRKTEQNLSDSEIAQTRKLTQMLVAEPFCYHSGRLCDCKTHICEGQDGYDKLSSDFAKPCRAPPAVCGGEWVDDRTYTSHPECWKPLGFGCRTVRK